MMINTNEKHMVLDMEMTSDFSVIKEHPQKATQTVSRINIPNREAVWNWPRDGVEKQD